METTQELIYQILAITVTGILGIIGAYLKKYITTKIDVTKYGFENERVERIIDNAVGYAEATAKTVAKEKAYKLAGSEKLHVARKYIGKIDPDIIIKYGKLLDDMIARKVQQVIR